MSLKFLPIEPPPDSPIAEFFRIRLMARSAHDAEAGYNIQLRLMQRARARLAAAPFNTHRVAQLDAHISDIKAEFKIVRDHMRDIGSFLIDLAPAIDAITTLDQRLELLNCNHADRSRIDEPDLGMVMLMAAYCVEDSAEHRNDEWNDRPLHTCVNAEMHHVMFHTAEGRELSDKLFDGLFAPGGMFEGMPKYYRQADGTMLRQASPLTVHDAAGSRVIERTPS